MSEGQLVCGSGCRPAPQSPRSLRSSLARTSIAATCLGTLQLRQNHCRKNRTVDNEGDLDGSSEAIQAPVSEHSILATP